jgi:FdhD protein
LNVKASKYISTIIQAVNDELADEEMIRIHVNSESYTITMRTPSDEEDLTRGILFTEDVYTNQEQHPEFSILSKNEKGFITGVNVNIPNAEIEKGIGTKRNLMSVTSCGMCGKQDLDLYLGNEKLLFKSHIQASLIQTMFQKMSNNQTLFQQSGGSHAAAAFDEQGGLLTIKEDIGRHNAVDKVIGNLLMNHNLAKATCLTVSGRLSYEIVSKCYKAGIQILASVSAPSSLAVEYCNDLGITLIAFCRDEKFTVYTNGERII